MKELRQKNDELIQSQTSHSELLTTLTGIEVELKSNNISLPESLSQINDSIIIKLLDELEDLRKDELQLDMVYQDEYPPLREIRDDIAEKERTILEAVRRYDDGRNSGSSVWSEMQTLRRRHTEIQLEISRLDARSRSAEERIQTLLDQLPELSVNSQEYNQIVREVEGYQRQYNRVLEREFALRGAVRSRVGELEVFTPIEGRILTTPVSKIYINFIIGGVVGLFASMGLAVMMNMMDTSIHSEDDVKHYLHETVLATIPKIKFSNSRSARRQQKKQQPLVKPGTVAESIVTLNDPKSPISEAYRSLRTNYQFATVKEQPRSLMITSAVPGEGKTTTAINTAVAFAASGVRVLLIDADLRRPNVHRMLKLKRNPGLSEVLSADQDIHEVMQSSHIDNLIVVPSGHLPHNPSELIGSRKMRELIAQMGQEFDLVICDAPSIIVVTDPILMSTQVDSILMVVSVNYARRETITRALKLLEGTSGHLVGVVLNGLEATRRRYYYYYYYDDAAAGKKKKKWFHE